MKYAVIYCRYSPRRHAEDCESIEVQLTKCRSYCLAMDYEVLGEFKDEAKSGKDRIRDGLDAAIEAVRGHQCMLVVRDFGRISRDVRNSLEIRDEVINSGGGLVDLELRLDTSGPLGKAVFTTIQAWKQYERESTAEKTSASLIWKQRRGQMISSNAPYGYKKGEKYKLPSGETRHKIVVDPVEMGIVKMVQDLAANGMNMNQIKNHMLKNKVKVRGCQFHQETVRRMLKGTVYETN